MIDLDKSASPGYRWEAEQGGKELVPVPGMTVREELWVRVFVSSHQTLLNAGLTHTIEERRVQGLTSEYLNKIACEEADAAIAAIEARGG